MSNTRHLFIAPDAKLRANWLEAFPDALLLNRIPVNPSADVIWVLLPEEGDIIKLLADCRSAAGKLPVIAISDLPSDQQGLVALGAGVVGYCNGHATPVVLRQVADTALGGGYGSGNGCCNDCCREYRVPQPKNLTRQSFPAGRLA